MIYFVISFTAKRKKKRKKNKSVSEESDDDENREEIPDDPDDTSDIKVEKLGHTEDLNKKCISYSYCCLLLFYYMRYTL